MDGGWEGWRGGGGALCDAAEPSHHMTAPADEAVPPAPVPGATARLPLAPGERRGAGPGTAALSGCGDQSNNFKMSGGPRISFDAIESALSSLKNCQSYINSGMDVATQVALDLVEGFNEEEDVNNMEKVMLEYATMDRELNHYIKAFEETINQVKQEKPENLPDLENLAQEKFLEMESKNSDSDLQRNEKYIYFKDQLKEMKKQYRGNDTIEQIDEDIAVTRSQTNFICPITQMTMKRPVRNKVCGHIYEEDAILEMIQTQKQKKKQVRCPKMGCSHVDVKESDLVPDEILKRLLDSQKKQSWSTVDT
ncbi:E3 SUMO-protein ligase NSE2 [Oenanthe melanoleuca]|uniref:E3 SUMO-protein ligase NSE2 n=1 Tax=Oenanthe melanoleuca TaxID=2939378 RepID=UPI0024C1CE5D|nr:E3 SUMO-protein ligase NSE2 [Oenanthe melanoleuca]